MTKGSIKYVGKYFVPQSSKPGLFKVNWLTKSSFLDFHRFWFDVLISWENSLQVYFQHIHNHRVTNLKNCFSNKCWCHVITSFFHHTFKDIFSSASSLSAVVTSLLYLELWLSIKKPLSCKYFMITKTFLKLPFKAISLRRLCSLCSWLVVLDLRNQTGFLTAHPPRHFQSSRKNDEGVLCTGSLPHTLLQQASLGLVGLRMEHDDRQKQSSAPPCSAVFYSARAWKDCYEAYNGRSDRSTLWVNKISVGEQLHKSLYCSCKIMSALKLCE